MCIYHIYISGVGYTFISTSTLAKAEAIITQFRFGDLIWRFDWLSYIAITPLPLHNHNWWLSWMGEYEKSQFHIQCDILLDEM